MANNYLDKKLLVVGAGGIGCELLKNLILTGFTQIEIVGSIIEIIVYFILYNLFSNIYI